MMLPPRFPFGRFLAAFIACGLAGPLVRADEFATPWEHAYQDAEASGAHVLGLWKFDDDKGLDATGKQPKGELKNGKLSAGGKFGGALESFAGFPVDRSHGFVVPDNPRLSPRGAFSIELWIKPKAEFGKRDGTVLIDKKYAGHDDYQLAIGAADPKQRRRLILALGFGAESQNFLSDPCEFPADEWVHVAVTYNGKGSVRFFRNGTPVGGADAPARGAVSAGHLPLSIGDRLGSYYPGFPGFLDEVRLTSGVREFGSLRIATKWPRRAFLRFEDPPAWTATVTNLRREPVTGARLTVAVGEAKPVEIELPAIAAGKSHDVPLTFDTKARPDVYDVTISVSLHAANAEPRAAREPACRETFPITLVPRPLPLRMPVVMWGIGGVQEVVTELPRLKRLGFTHCFGGEVDHRRIAAATEPTLTTRPENMPATVEMLDTALANDLRILAVTSPASFDSSFPQFMQTGRDGRPRKRPCLTPNAPPVMRAFERAGASIAKTYAQHPAFEGVCVNSEIRDETEVSFTEFDLAAYRRAFGARAEFPDWVQSKFPPKYTTLKDFPKDRVVPDDHPQLAFYRWWWSVGDGWNEAHSAVSRGLHQNSPRKDLWTFHDPAVRCPPLWGSGGEVDVLSQWTYTNPDPLRMSLPVDEMFAMASGRQPTAPVMKMTQLFWYRSATAPEGSSPRPGSNPAKWVDQDPDASYISIHPHHLREAVWTMLARPVKGVMFHGWQSLVPTDGSHPYKYTHPQLQHEFARLTSEIIVPLGPTLVQVPAAPGDIAFLESFTTFAFTAKGSWGYAGGWQADVYFALQHARLQPEVIYEQHISRDGLDRYKVLVMADCDVLTREVVDRVLAFQRRGGLVVGDDALCPAIKADVVLPRFARVNDAAKDKAALLRLADEIRSRLDGKVARIVDTTSPEVVPHRRRAGDADYIFLVNDAREAGDYVGQYGRVHERGVPTSAEVRVRSDATAIYDLVEHHAVPFRREGADKSQAAEGAARPEATLVVPLTLGPCEGRLLLASPRPIAGVTVTGPDAAVIGRRWSGQITVTDSSGQPINAVIPLEVEIRDSDGRTAEFTGHYGATAGRLDLNLDLAANDHPGVWEIRVRELASGLRATRYVRVTRG